MVHKHRPKPYKPDSNSSGIHVSLTSYKLTWDSVHTILWLIIYYYSHSNSKIIIPVRLKKKLGCYRYTSFLKTSFLIHLQNENPTNFLPTSISLFCNRRFLKLSTKDRFFHLNGVLSIWVGPVLLLNNRKVEILPILNLVDHGTLIFDDSNDSTRPWWIESR